MSESIRPGVVSYNAGILGAGVCFTALSSVQGQVIREGLSWELKAVEREQRSHTSDLAQPQFVLTPGPYQLRVKYHEVWCDLGTIQLDQNTSTDMVFILENSFTDQDSDYFSEHDLNYDFSRRQQERDAQSVYALATLPLRDPNPQGGGDMGVRFMAHPMLQLPQFDGIPPDMRPDPHENKEALQLTLTQKLAAAPSTAPVPTPHLR